MDKQLDPKALAQALKGTNTLAGLTVPQAPPDDYLARNAAYVAPGAHTYNTQLALPDELQFRQWLAQNNVPFDPNAPVSDYDMRGFWQGMQNGKPQAASAIDPNDGRLHYPDYWKTPYHETFSGESQWATPVAPLWNDQDQLVAPSGRILFDDRQQPKGDQ